ncbi:MAG: HlyD family efflux transporter periplasmic adaptor subunit [Marinobacter sp.]|uniref:efflux RND transporter periplasmic adaptor subunit n=1 Tax=Marinobacter sp. TaxID=50741 RepID=UPI00299D6A66|nr:HlyD family efflux transporter periplasmic adaptor subunit [Marinobacter sp.]MDX1755314.1 HlyD family efflux transporter periplasmic adaptor subunit [Marinobacter sp.]
MLKRLTPLLVLAIGIAGFMALKWTRPEPPSVTAQERSWRVDTLTVALQRHHPQLALYGQVTAPDMATLAAPVAAQVASRPVEEGQRVAAGAVLVALAEADIAPLLVEAQAEVADLEAQLRSEAIRYANDRQALVNEQAIVANAERQLERTRTLVARNLASQDQLDNARDALAQARLTLAGRQRAIDEHTTREQSLKARLSRAQARLEATRRDVRRSEVAAPFAGIVTDIQVAPGDQVARYQSLLSVYPVHGLELRAQIPDVYREELAQALAEGQILEAVAAEGGYRFRMKRFAGQGAPSGTEAMFQLQGESGALRPGGMLPVVLRRPPIASAVAVPYSALYGNNSVYTVSPEQRLRRLNVRLRGEVHRDDGQRWALISGEALADGQRLVITHLPNALEGLKVDVANEGNR